MRIKFTLFSFAVMLFVIPGTGYGMVSDSDRRDTVPGIVPAMSQIAIASEKPNVGPAVSETGALANPEKVTIDEKAGSNPSVATNIPLETSAWAVHTNHPRLDPEKGGNTEPPDSTTPAEGSLVSQWLEVRAIEEATLADALMRSPSTENAQDIDTDLGGGWCDRCGCWMKHGLDPNGTPQEQIGHPYVCVGGANMQNCWSHYYSYCGSS